MLVGRGAEQGTLDALLDSARDEHGTVLVLRGAPGIGKTALLDYAAAQADDMRVLRCTGIEAEHELPFAGLHQLVRPHLELVERLPDPQAAALGAAFGLSSEGVGDRFLVSLGLLSLLAEAGEEGPLVCCVDDAQWLDTPSAEALLFAARRLGAEPIAMVIAVRDGEVQRFESPGVPELELEPLADGDAEALLSRRLPRPASPEVLDRLLENAAGNPLALLELPAALSPAQLEGAEPVLGPPPVRPAVEETFRARVEALPERTRRILLLAAADEVGDVRAVRGAAERLGLDGADLDEAERDGLVEVNAAVVFRHPLVRSAVYRSAAREERKAAHEALAAVVDDRARSTWHRALVAERADEGIAAELEAAGVQAVTRGAQATASAAFERAAELSPERARRGHRLAFAAQASLDAGRPDTALALVERARPFTEDPLDEIQLDMIRASDAARRGEPAECSALMRRAVPFVAKVAPEQAAELLVWSVTTSLVSRRVEEAVAAAQRLLEEIDTSGAQGRFVRTLVEGVAAVMAGDYELGGRRYALAYELGKEFSDGNLQLLNAFVAAFRGDYTGSRRVSEEAIALARARGSLTGLAGVFPLLVIGQLGEGRLAAAAAAISEGLDLTARLGFENDETGLIALQARVAAQRGREEECRELAEAALRRSMAKGVAWATDQARLALADLELGLGNAREALEQLEQLDPLPVPPVRLLASGDLIDAALRLGEPERARLALEELEAWSPVSDAPLPSELLLRCRAVLAEDGDDAARVFEDALARYGHDAPSFECARTQLAYGERLRRERRKLEARTQLRNALDTFEGLGARLWAERARGELAATGETARKRDASTLDELTPQELRIAQLVACGATNRDAAAQLFVSPKTVEYHLRKVFMKLGVSSRVELARTPLGEPAAAAAQGPD